MALFIGLILGVVVHSESVKHPDKVKQSDFAACFSHKLGDCNGSEGAGE